MKLSELAVISAGQGAPQGESAYGSEGIPFIKAGDLASLLAGKKESEIQHVNESVAKKHKLKLYPAGSILFAKSGMSCMKGYVYKTENPCYVVSHLAIISPTRCNADFLKYYFQFHKPNSLVKDAAYPSISLADIGEMEINVPSLSKQQEIVAALENITELIAMRKEQLAKLDQLVKSRFNELFGDPVTNEKNWARLTLGDICEIGSSKRVFEKDYVPKGVPFFRTKEIVELSKGNPISTELFITEEHFEELRKIYGAPKKDDLLISAVGTIGTIWIVSGDFEFYFKDGNLIQIKSSPNFNSIFMKYLLDELIANYKKEMSTGTAYSALTIAGLKKMLVYDVPLFLQEQFAAFVEQTDKSKLAIQQSLDKLETLKKSLMQEYFG